MNQIKINILFLLVLLTACSPQKKLARLHKKHPELFKTETIIIKDTVVVPEVKHDTVFKFNNLYDTVTISKDRLIIKTVKLPGDSIWIEGKCLSDTIYIEREIKVDKAIITETPFYLKGVFWFFVLIILLITFILLQLKKI